MPYPKGKTWTPEQRARLSEAIKGKERPGAKGRVSPTKGVPQTDEARAKMSAAKKGKPQTEQQKAALAIVRATPEYRARRKEIAAEFMPSMKGIPWTPEQRAKIMAARAEHKLRPIATSDKALITYGLTRQDAEAMLVRQGGVCAICLIADCGLVVDHCHNSLRVRGFLCNPCNQSIGGLKDDPVRLRRAADYVEKGGF